MVTNLDKKITVYVDPAYWKALKKVAVDDEVSLSALVNSSIRMFLDEFNGKVKVLAPKAEVRIVNDTDGEKVITVRDVLVHRVTGSDVTIRADKDATDLVRID